MKLAALGDYATITLDWSVTKYGSGTDTHAKPIQTIEKKVMLVKT